MPYAFGSMEFSDAASLFEESPLEEFILNNHRTNQVVEELVLVPLKKKTKKKTILNAEIFFSLYIILIKYFNF